MRDVRPQGLSPSVALRTAAAALLAAAVVGVFGALVIGRDDSATPDPIGIGLLWAATTLVAVVFPGLVVFGRLRKRGLVQWWYFGLAGAFLGVVAQIVWLLPFLFFGLLASLIGLKLFLEALGICSVAGFLGGVVFWFALRR